MSNEIDKDYWNVEKIKDNIMLVYSDYETTAYLVTNLKNLEYIKIHASLNEYSHSELEIDCVRNILTIDDYDDLIVMVALDVLTDEKADEIWDSKQKFRKIKDEMDKEKKEKKLYEELKRKYDKA